MNDSHAAPLTGPRAGSSAPAASVIFMPIVVSRAGSGYPDVHAGGVPVVVDHVDAAARAIAAVAVAESVAFAAGQAQGADGQDDD